MRLIASMSHVITDFMPDETGTSLMEYALLGLLIAVVSMLALFALDKVA